MDDISEVIRRQMEETKSQLSEKLETLEQQVAETVHSTGTAVNATVGAVQETVETVTGAIQDAVQSVSNAFDFNRQFQQHPWLVVGGSFVLGYLAAELLMEPTSTSQPQHPSTDPPKKSREDAMVETAATTTPIAAASEPGLNGSSWRRLRGVAFRGLSGMVREIASRAVPPFVDYLIGDPNQPTVRREAANGVAKSPNTRGGPQ